MTTKIRELTRDDVEITVDIEAEDQSPRDHFTTEDENPEDQARNESMVEDIERRLADGDLWAFGCVTVTVSWEGMSASDVLGGCSYDDEADFRKDEGYFGDMVDEALRRLNADVAKAAEKLARLSVDSPVEDTEERTIPAVQCDGLSCEGSPEALILATGAPARPRSSPPRDRKDPRTMSKPTPDQVYEAIVASEDGQAAFDEARERLDEATSPEDLGEDDELYDEFEAAREIWEEMKDWAKETFSLTDAELEEYAQDVQESIVAGLT